MNFLADIPSLSSAVLTFAMTHSGRLPQGAAPLLATAASKVSPVDSIVSVAECLYANQAAMADAAARAAAQTLCGQCAAFAAQYGWHGMDLRGPGMVAAMRRELGEADPAGAGWPDPSADPAPKPEWTAPAAAG